MKGGFLLNPLYRLTSTSNEDAVKYFKSNSQFSLLTNSSSASITFKATLNPEVISPFIHIRSGRIDNPVKYLLFKYFLINSVEPVDPENVFTFYTQNNRETHGVKGMRNYIELTTVAQIQHEYDIQLEIYQKTYNTISSAYEPVCPYPISCLTDLDKDSTIREIINNLDATNRETNVLTITDTLSGDLDDLDEEDVNSRISIYNNKTRATTEHQNDYRVKLIGAEARKIIESLGCIVMEFMDDYDTLKDYLDTHGGDSEEGKRAKSLAAYELVRVKEIGLEHLDLINENIMYNSNYKYITDDDTKKGRALLIDFSKSVIDKTQLRIHRAAWLDTLNDDEVERHRQNKIVYEAEQHIQTFHEGYPFEDIYEKRLNATLQFREKTIKGFQRFITEYKEKKSEDDKAELLEKSHITQEKIRDFIYIFVSPTVAFASEEFPVSFSDSTTDKFEKQLDKILELQEIATKVHADLTEIAETDEKIEKLLEQEHQHTSKKQKTYVPQKTSVPLTGKKLFESLTELIEERNAQQQFRIEKAALSSQGSSISSQEYSKDGGRLINYDKKHKVYNKHFPHSLHPNQHNSRIRNTLKIKYRQTKKSKPKKSKPKKSKRKKRKRKKRKLTKRKPTKSRRKK